MSPSTHLGGAFTSAGTSLALNRMGYGAMQFTGPMAFGPPRDRQAALAVVREAVRLGLNHIDTSDYDNLSHLGLDVLEIVNLRVGGQFGPNENSVAEPLTALADLQAKGLIRHIGLSNISQRQFVEAQAIAKIVCVQNHYNLAHRQDDPFIDTLAKQGIAYVPFFPLGGFRPLQSPLLDAAAAPLGATTRQVALAWLLQRSPNILIIAGTSSVEDLHDNLKAASLALPADIVAQLDRIAVLAAQEKSKGRSGDPRGR
jgi:pyridoxine 4-dehydrogenase